jgi:hypothetical protein
MNEIGVVISRYYEDLRWVEEIKSNIDVYVYNRSGESPGMGVPNAVAWSKPKDPNDILGGLDISKCVANGINLKIIDIPDDPGFEASTYAYHMHSKYDELNNYTVFIQAHPQIYVKNVIDILNNPEKIKHTTYIKNSTEQLSPAIAQQIDHTIDFEPFCDQLCTLYSEQDYQWSLYKNDFFKIPWLEFCKNMNDSIIDENGYWHPASHWSFGAGNQFIASKKIIQNNPPEYYKKIQDFTNTYMDPNGDNRPHWQQLNQGPNILEGIWKFVFLNQNKKY